jgi:large subunit ribosomal protein L31e
MAKKEETKEKIEREYVIPLREKCRPVPRYKKTNKAVKSVKEFLARHMKIRDRDLDKIKLDIHLNEFLWARGIKNPPHKVKVKAIKEDDIVRVDLAEYPEKLKFKKLRLEKRETKTHAKKKSAKKEIEKSENFDDKTEETKKEEFEENKASVIEEGGKFEKLKAREMKKTTKVKSPEQIEDAIKEPQAK